MTGGHAEFYSCILPLLAPCGIPAQKRPRASVHGAFPVPCNVVKHYCPII